MATLSSFLYLTLYLKLFPPKSLRSFFKIHKIKNITKKKITSTHDLIYNFESQCLINHAQLRAAIYPAAHQYGIE